MRVVLKSILLVISHNDSILVYHYLLDKLLFDLVHWHIRGEKQVKVLFVVEIVVFLFSDSIKERMLQSLIDCQSFPRVK